MKKPVIDPAMLKNSPSQLAVECAIGIANYCLSRFPCDLPPHPLFDVPYFAEDVQRCIDEATTIGLSLEKSLKEADAKLAMALALTDTGSVEFKKAFPPLANGEIVSGWRVVEKIREVLLSGEKSTEERNSSA